MHFLLTYLLRQDGVLNPDSSIQISGAPGLHEDFCYVVKTFTNYLIGFVTLDCFLMVIKCFENLKNPFQEGAVWML